MRKLLLWLVMVAVMIAAILGGTAAFLYSRTGTDALPQEAVTFGEQTLEPNGWSWVIPVLGDKVNKTYESPTNLTVQKLGTFTDTVPQLVLPDWVTAAELQIAAPDGTVWTGRTGRLQYLYLYTKRRLSDHRDRAPQQCGQPRRPRGLVRLPLPATRWR